VAKLEAEIVKAAAGRTVEGLPGRNGYGTLGTLIKLRTNSFPISLTGTKVPWYRYLIDITPAPSAPKRRAIITQMIKDAGNFLNEKHRATDYATILLLNEKLPDTELKVLLRQSPTVPVNTDNSPHAAEIVKRNTYNVKITYQDQFSLEHLVEWLQSPSATAVYSARTDVIQLINIILCQGPNDFANIKCIRQNKFYPDDDHPDPEIGPLSGGLQALRGFYASVRPATHRLLLNLNVTAGAFYKPVSLLQLWDLYQPLRNGNARSNDQWKQIASFCRHLKFRTMYAKDKQPRDKNFVSFCTKPLYGNADQVKIKWKGPGGTGAERENTVTEFFKQEYNIKLKYPQLPVVNVATQQNQSWIPPELAVRVLPGQSYNRLLSGNDTSDMLRFAARPPFENAQSLAGTAEAVGKGLRIFRLAHPSGDMQANGVAKWGFRVATHMITIPGRILEAPMIQYGAGPKGRVYPKSGSWNSAEKQFHTPGSFARWQIVAINGALDGRHADVAKRFENHLKGCGLNMGGLGKLGMIDLRDMRDPRNRDYNDEMIRRNFETAQQNRCNIQLIALPDQDKWLYARIKYWADVVYGVGTVCCVARKFLKEQGQGMYFGNLALKYACEIIGNMKENVLKVFLGLTSRVVESHIPSLRRSLRQWTAARCSWVSM
jgi:hypothetical protein